MDSHGSQGQASRNSIDLGDPYMSERRSPEAFREFVSTEDDMSQRENPAWPLDVEISGPMERQQPAYMKLIRYFVHVVTIFLAMIIVITGMLANEGENWRVLFLVLWITWLVLLISGIYLDLRNRDSRTFQTRVLWHLGTCVVTMSFFITVFKLSSDTLPQWIPTIIVSGLALSATLQNLPDDLEAQLASYIRSFGAIFYCS